MRDPFPPSGWDFDATFADTCIIILFYECMGLGGGGGGGGQK
jgi:hypothetical protein